MILVLAPVYALSHAWGWLLRGRGVLAWSGGHASASVKKLAERESSKDHC